MNKFECLCAHINCGNGYVPGWKSVKYTYPGNGEIILEVTYKEGEGVSHFKFKSMRTATKFLTDVFRWTSTGKAA
jgi:hypothetical protein